jgi:cation diffusion facilitator family transporter
MKDKPGSLQPAGKHADGRVSVIAAIIGNILVGIVKFIAAAISGSAAMISEGIHSIVDSGNGILVLFGMNRSKKEPDYLHPFGYGKELYFWTLVVALLIFLLGGGISLYKGVNSCIEVYNGTHTLGETTLNYIVLVAAMIIEGTSLFVAVKQFNQARGEVGPLRFIRDTKDPSLYTVVLEDSAAELGLVVALLSTFLAQMTGNMYFDGVASIIIGLLLCFVAIILLRETKGLLVGEGMMHQSLDEVRDIVESDPRVVSCGRILTMYMGPQSLLIAIDATFKNTISAHDVLLAVDEIERKILQRWPQTTRVFIEAESMRQVVAQQIEEASWEDEYEDEDAEQGDW